MPLFHAPRPSTSALVVWGPARLLAGLLCALLVLCALVPAPGVLAHSAPRPRPRGQQRLVSPQSLSLSHSHSHSHSHSPSHAPAGMRLLAGKGKTTGAQMPFASSSAGKHEAAATASSADASAASASASAVSYTPHAVLIAGTPTFIFSAEFHPFRVPVERLWRDALAKLKTEGGFNTVSIYTHWGLISPSPHSQPDLSGINDLGLFLDVAKDVGLMVNVRLGPYINAETTAGGMPGWVQRLPAELRTDAQAFTSAWKPYVEALGGVIASRQLQLAGGSGSDIDASSGPVVFVQLENEYYETHTTGPYVRLLRQTLREAGVRDALFTYNEASALYPAGNFDSIVDLYGVDAYPQGFDCSHPSVWTGVSMGYAPAVRKLNLTEPLSLWEFQAGSFDPYDGAGYAQCYALTNERFARVFDRANLAQGFTVLSHYMAHGGTNWGNLAEPTVYTSYDYGAPLSEDRQVRDKLREYGLLAQFLASSPQFTTSQQVASAANAGVAQRSTDLFVTHRRAATAAAKTGDTVPAPKTGDTVPTPNWYIVRQNDSTSTRTASFHLSVDVGSNGHGQTRTIPTHGNITLDGRDSRIIATNHALPSGNTLLYSTAAMSFAGRIHDGLDVVVLYGDVGQSFEAVVRGPKGLQAKVVSGGSGSGSADAATADAGVDINANATAAEVRLNWHVSSAHSATYVQLASPESKAATTLLILADTAYAYLTRPLSLAAVGTRGHYLVGGGADGETLLVHGGYHLSSASLSRDGDGLLALTGQSNASHAALELFAPRDVAAVSFNGAVLPRVQSTDYGSVRASLPDVDEAARRWVPPPLSGWKYADSLPEVQDGANSIGATPAPTAWVRANKTHTHNPYFYLREVRTGGTVLFADEYGFHGGHVLWQGRFPSPASSAAHRRPTGLKLRIQGGSFFGASAWLNGVHLGSVQGSANRSDGTIIARSIDLAAGTDADAANVLTVLHDSTGLEEAVGGKALGAGNLDDTQARTPYDRGARFPLEGPKLPRGILAYEFLYEGAGGSEGGGETDAQQQQQQQPRLTIDEWHVRGNYGGEACPDAVRKCLNEGGLRAEVEGWHLPGFPYSRSRANFTDVPASASSASSLPLSGKAGVRFFSTDVTLDVPSGYDVPLSVVFPAAPSASASKRGEGAVAGAGAGASASASASASAGATPATRTTLYVNGYQFGVYLPSFGPQSVFPVPLGVLNPQGVNKVALLVWSLGEGGAEGDAAGGSGGAAIPAPVLSLSPSAQDGGGPYAGDPLDTPGPAERAPRFAFEEREAGWGVLRGGE